MNWMGEPISVHIEHKKSARDYPLAARYAIVQKVRDLTALVKYFLIQRAHHGPSILQIDLT